MRGKDGRWLYTPPCGFRAKWPSERRTPVYRHDQNIEFSILALEYFLEYEYGQLLLLFGLVIMLKMDFLKL